MLCVCVGGATKPAADVAEKALLDERALRRQPPAGLQQRQRGRGPAERETSPKAESRLRLGAAARAAGAPTYPIIFWAWIAPRPPLAPHGPVSTAVPVPKNHNSESKQVRAVQPRQLKG